MLNSLILDLYSLGSDARADGTNRALKRYVPYFSKAFITASDTCNSWDNVRARAGSARRCRGAEEALHEFDQHQRRLRTLHRLCDTFPARVIGEHTSEPIEAVLNTAHK